jgi:hypothetical protein
MRQTRLKFGLVMVSLILTVYTHAGEYFVALDGADSNNGSRQQPFRTIQKAADLMKPGDTCYVRGGLYRQVVRPKRSGSERKPIRFEAWPGEVVVLSGTEPIRGEWSVHKGRIYKTKVREVFDQLFVDGQMMIEARWPNMRFEQRFDKSVWATAGEGSSYGTMVDPAIANTGIDWTGGIATLNVGSWQTWSRIVRNHKVGGDRFNYSRDLSVRLESKRQWGGFDHYFISGRLDALDIPTEWHLDRNKQLLYLWYPDGENPAGHNIEAKVRDYAFEADGLKYIELKGFHFFAATFRLEKCDNCVIENCHLRFSTRAHGLDAAPPTLMDGDGNIMKNCSVVYSDGPAVTVKGANNTLENCLFHDIDWHGLINGLGVSTSASARSVIRRCTIFNVGASEGLVLPSKGPSIVEYNYIHHAGLVQSDGSLIQSHGINLNNTVIRYNWVHDHNAFNWGGIGIRGDDLTRNLLVHHNVVWNCAEKGIIVKGDHNRVFNNTCLNNPVIDILTPSRAEPFKPWNPKQHPHLLDKQNANTTIANNYAQVITGTFPWQKTKAPPLGRMENNYHGEDPMLVDPAEWDFRPRKGSPLIDAGKQLPPVTDGYWGNAPDIGAYEFGGLRWLPGCYNALWISAPQRRADGKLVVRVALRMPPTEPVSLEMTSSQPGVEPKNLVFTPANWMTAQAVNLNTSEWIQSLRFSDKHLGTAKTSDPATLDAQMNLIVRFDRPMLPTKPANFTGRAK